MAEVDPVLVENTGEWLVRAKEDIETAAFLLTATPPYVRSAVFHCQQAVEKAMKAFLTWHDTPFRMTHNLVELGDSCAAVDANLALAVEQASVLAKYATRFRYPGAPYSPSIEEAQQALHAARSFLTALLSRFPSDIVSAAGLTGLMLPLSAP